MPRPGANRRPAPNSDVDGTSRPKPERAATPQAANIFLKTMSVLMEFALEAELIDHNPVRDVKKIAAKSDGFHTWTVAEVAAYEARHPVGTMARLAMDLMLYTGLRRSDVVRVGRSHIAGDVLSIQPVKTQRSSGVTVTVRILPALAESISKTETGEKTLLISGWNKPFATKGFGNWFRDRCDEAGVPGSAYGLRKAAATRCAENGATASELMAMFGWTTLQEAERYTRAAERRRLGLKGSERLKVASCYHGATKRPHRAGKGTPPLNCPVESSAGRLGPKRRRGVTQAPQSYI